MMTSAIGWPNRAPANPGPSKVCWAISTVVFHDCVIQSHPSHNARMVVAGIRSKGSHIQRPAKWSRKANAKANTPNSRPRHSPQMHAVTTARVCCNKDASAWFANTIARYPRGLRIVEIRVTRNQTVLAFCAARAVSFLNVGVSLEE